MKYCPNCRGEFEDWAETCTDCQVPLVAALPAEPAIEEVLEKLPVMLAKYGNVVDANLIKEILESEGITSAVIDEQGINTSWTFSHVGVGAYIQVKGADFTRATEIIKSVTEIPPVMYADESGPDDEEDEDELNPVDDDSVVDENQ